MIKKYIVSLSITATMLLVSGCDFSNEYDKVESVNLKAPDKIEVECNIDNNDLVLFTFGQSNAANSVNEYANAINENLIEIHDGKCYIMNDPLLGTNGDGGTVWTNLGNILLENKSSNKVYFINTAIGGSAISSWIPGGDNNHLLVDKMKMANDMGVDIDMFLWHQGETDAILSTPAETYYDNFMLIHDEIILAHPYSKILVARASKCGDISSPFIINTQNNLISNNYNIYSGPYTDVLGNSYRYDGCHFNGLGAKYHAALWYDDIKKLLN